MVGQNKNHTTFYKMSKKPRYPVDPDSCEGGKICASNIVPILRQNPIGLATSMNIHSRLSHGTHKGKTKHSGNVIVEMPMGYHFTAHPSGRTNAIHVKGHGEEVGLIPVHNSKTGKVKHLRRLNVGKVPASRFLWEGAEVARNAIGNVVRKEAAKGGPGSAAATGHFTRKLRKRSKSLKNH